MSRKLTSQVKWCIFVAKLRSLRCKRDFSAGNGQISFQRLRQSLPGMSLVVLTPSFFKREWRSSKPRAIRIMDTGACSSRIPKGIFSRSMRTSDAPLKRRLDAQRPEGQKPSGRWDLPQGWTPHPDKKCLTFIIKPGG